jgi:hypothetical protein
VEEEINPPAPGDEDDNVAGPYRGSPRESSLIVRDCPTVPARRAGRGIGFAQAGDGTGNRNVEAYCVALQAYLVIASEPRSESPGSSGQSCTRVMEEIHQHLVPRD